MNNSDVQAVLDKCAQELGAVQAVHAGLGATSAVAPYLTHYALIRACGAIEVSVKAVVADYCARRSKLQVKRYLAKTVRESPRIPSYSRMCELLLRFDTGWNKEFKERIRLRPDQTAILMGLQSLVDARNDFAHGGLPTVTIGDVMSHFASARAVVEELDAVVQ